MHDAIFDGKCHVISEEYGYIAKKVEEDSLTNINFTNQSEELIREYAEYLFKNNKEKVIEYILHNLRSQIYAFKTEDNFQIIYRPPWITSCLAQCGTFVLRFKRSKNDKLVTP